MSILTPTILFSNPVFQDGVNITVRRGSKWHGTRTARIDLGGGYSTLASGMHTRLVKFSDLTDKDVLFEHDPACRTVDGLAAELARVYPEFTRDDEVTVVTFILNYRVPTLDDDAIIMDMVPIVIGKLDNVIELNDDFYEIHCGHRKLIVHATHYQYTSWNENGWFMNY